VYSTHLSSADRCKLRETDHAPLPAGSICAAAGMFFGYPYCHTAGRGPPEERTVGVGLPLNDPQLNTDSRVQCEVEDRFVSPSRAVLSCESAAQLFSAELVCSVRVVADKRLGLGGGGSHVRAVQALGPHTAPLGMKFYTGTMFPSEYRNAAFVAEHGSWNRAEKIGCVRLIVSQVVLYRPERRAVTGRGLMVALAVSH
jgi:hypothetical protein